MFALVYLSLTGNAFPRKEDLMYVYRYFKSGFFSNLDKSFKVQVKFIYTHTEEFNNI